MSISRTFRLALLLCSGAFLAPQALADDIDIFLGSSGGTADAPNVMILIDNGSNWARQAQAWGNGMNQGQAELNAISQALNSLAGQSMPIMWGSRCSRRTAGATALAVATSASVRAT